MSLAALLRLRYTARMSLLSPLPQHRRAIGGWLVACLCLVALMVAVGGVTRLTESGLSIVEWKLVSGTLPPLNEAAWQAEFNAYQQTPQFQQVNRDFSLVDFKGIFWLEYLHRLLGRIIGMAVILPFAYFALRGWLPKPLLKRGLVIAVLVGAQGTVGWVMVASGLQDQPRVEPLKLAAHLLLAFSVFGVMLWTLWQVRGTPRFPATKNIALSARYTLILLVAQIFFGALVAGLRAGLTYNTYPLMDGALIPEGLHRLQPWWLNHVESVLTVQFQHRMGALAVAATVLLLAHFCRRIQRLKGLSLALMAVVLVQFMLGVATLLSHVNLWLASAHQLVALLLFSLLLRAVYLLPLDVNQQHLKIVQ